MSKQTKQEEGTMAYTDKEQAIQDALHHPWTWCYRGTVKVRFIPEQNKLEVKERGEENYGA